jgi:hypothetical protein
MEAKMGEAIGRLRTQVFAEVTEDTGGRPATGKRAEISADWRKAMDDAGLRTDVPGKKKVVKEDDNDDEEDEGPQEDDITTEDHQNFYQNGRQVFEVTEAVDGGYLLLIKGVQFGGKRDRSGAGNKVFKTVEAAVKAYMDQDQFWPNCWFISDHGNAHIMKLTEAVLTEDRADDLVTELSAKYTDDASCIFQVGDRVRQSGRSLESSRMYYLGLGDYTRKNAAKADYERQRDRRGTVVACGTNGYAVGAVVKWDDGAVSESMQHRLEKA